MALSLVSQYFRVVSTNKVVANPGQWCVFIAMFVAHALRIEQQRLSHLLEAVVRRLPNVLSPRRRTFVQTDCPDLPERASMQTRVVQHLTRSLTLEANNMFPNALHWQSQRFARHNSSSIYDVAVLICNCQLMDIP